MATVISSRPWEAGLVDAACETGLVRLVARCCDPADVRSVDAIVVGTETPWLSLPLVARWRALGIAVVGIFPFGDRAAIKQLCQAGVDQLFVETADPIVVLRSVRDLANNRSAQLARSRGGAVKSFEIVPGKASGAGDG